MGWPNELWLNGATHLPSRVPARLQTAHLLLTPPFCADGSGVFTAVSNDMTAGDTTTRQEACEGHGFTEPQCLAVGCCDYYDGQCFEEDSHTLCTIGSSTTSAAWADLDGDGDADMV